jgi:hypothetical protein
MLKRYFVKANIFFCKFSFFSSSCVSEREIFLSSFIKINQLHTGSGTLLHRLREIAGNVDFGLHSLRSGGATVAANASVSDRCWKRHGRWKCDKSKDGYVADSLDRRLAVTKQLGIL